MSQFVNLLYTLCNGLFYTQRPRQRRWFCIVSVKTVLCCTADCWHICCAAQQTADISVVLHSILLTYLLCCAADCWHICCAAQQTADISVVLHSRLLTYLLCCTADYWHICCAAQQTNDISVVLHSRLLTYLHKMLQYKRTPKQNEYLSHKSYEIKSFISKPMFFYIHNFNCRPFIYE
jgi:hypothetical protein